MATSNGRELDYETGILSLSEQQEQFLGWLCGDRPDGESQTAYAKRLGVHPNSLIAWKKDRSFQRLWEERMRATHARPDVLSAQLAALDDLTRNAASAGERIRATELYWKLVDKMSPDRVEVSGTEAVKSMSDEDLATALKTAADAAVQRAMPEDPKVAAARVRADLGMRVV